MRLDQYLVTKEHSFSRNKAQEMIKNGCVKVNDAIIKKPSFSVSDSDRIDVVLKHHYVSRAAYKLKYYLEKHSIDFSGKKVLDIGSSTGGFTQVALESGASKVVSVDVGSNQMHKTLRENSKIELYENTDIRDFVYPEKFDVIVSDVSFISLLKITDKIDSLAKEDIILLFKPQFEVGRDAKRDKKGVVTDIQAVKNAKMNFEKSCASLGWFQVRSEESGVKGKEGNREFIYHFKKV
jgi:23S rRNA (cytidine1920-2'-O)/16S rRNA (cytidine1409-2'-O)-methyltransferase